MPLIQCPDCLADMSTTAGKCQRCGSTTCQQKNWHPFFYSWDSACCYFWHGFWLAFESQSKLQVSSRLLAPRVCVSFDHFIATPSDI